ncbi:MAG TPA: methyltransferase domain-containing protein [Acetobacteraceae bacterium]|nr:methyltransferase domain-containing protein [Acetobacteraceae bacterium]
MQDPAAIVAPYVHAGMTVLEPGPGMEFFTLELARLVGPAGRVIAVDVQPRMIAGLRRRARRAGLLDRIDARVAPSTSMNVADIAGSVDLVCAFAVVHEMPAPGLFFVEVADALKPDATLLLAEPAGHVDAAEFQEELAAAAQAGLTVEGHPAIRHCRTALLRKHAHANPE